MATQALLRYRRCPSFSLLLSSLCTRVCVPGGDFDTAAQLNRRDLKYDLPSVGQAKVGWLVSVRNFISAPSRFRNGAEHGYVDGHHLRSALLKVPQLMHPRGYGRAPCPRCKTRRDVVVKGWLQKLTRRAVLLDVLGYLYECRNCVENKGKPKARFSSFRHSLI